MIILGYFVMCLIFGTTFLSIKMGIDAGFAPFFSAGIRFFIAGLLLFTWLVTRRKVRISLFLRGELALIGIGLTFGTFSTLYWAEQHITSGVAAVLSASGPIMIIFIQSFILKNAPSRKSLIGCLIGMIGVALLLLPSLTFEASIYWLLGCLAILLGEIFYASGTLYSKHVMERFADIPPIALNAVQMMYGGAMLMVLSFFTEHPKIDSLFSINAAGSLFYLIVAGSMVGHSIYYWLVAKTNPVFPSTWLFVSPIIALILGSVLYQETITWSMGIGALTILMGIILVNADGLKMIISKRNLHKT